MKDWELKLLGAVCTMVVAPVMVSFLVYRAVRHLITGAEMISEEELMAELAKKAEGASAFFRDC